MYTNSKIDIAMIFDDTNTMIRQANRILSEIREEANTITTSDRTFSEVTDDLKSRGYFVQPMEESDLDQIAEYCIETWFCRITLHNVRLQGVRLHGKRRNTVVLDNRMQMDKNYFLDVLEPLSCHQDGGGLILLSDFLEADHIKYTRSIRPHLRDYYANSVYDNFNISHN